MIIYYLVLFLSFFIIAWFIRLNRFVFHAVAKDSVALVNFLIADTEGDTKIEQIQKSTNALVLSLGKMLLFIFIAFAIGSIPIIIYCFISQTKYAALDFSSFYAILAISLGATIPFLLPGKKARNSEYSELSQLLHKMALNNYYIGNKLFNRERKKFRKKNIEQRTDFIIVSGLARAGTTSLMNDLSKIDTFVSLSYANMPFLMSPNTWKKFYNPKSGKLKERSHKDGILIGLNSNEALEEYFFKVKTHDSFIENTHLMQHSISDDVYNDYIDYQTLIKQNSNKIYLAKNNNFLLRYNSIRALNDNFVMVILFRDPITHAASLLEKHHEYKKLQQEDTFVLEYMNWLGHHEFGLNQKSFMFENSLENKHNKDSLDFWLQNWINYYQYALTIDHPKTVFISYDSYCAKPRETIKNILNKIGVDVELPQLSPFKNSRKVDFDYSTELFEAATEIYQKLKQRE